MTRPTPARIVMLGAILVTLLASCARGRSDASLALSLKPGMERTMRFVTEQKWSGARGSTVPGVPATGSPDLSSLTIVYRFRVASVDAQGTAKVDATVTDIRFPHGSPTADTLRKAMMNDHTVVTVDRQGRLLSLSSDRSPAGFSGLPRPPGSPVPQGPVAGDLGTLFGALDGRRVSVGETWTTEVPVGASGIHGTLHWTLASIAGTTARLEYSGRIAQENVSLPGLPTGAVATLSGDMSGYVALELETGWPTQGRTDTTLVITLKRPSESPTRLVTLRIVSRFEPGS
ncbi:MAG TPA: DUF6263 family protein [Spirochaetia bacterium]